MTIDSAKAIVKKGIDSVEDCYDSIEIQFMGGEPLVQFPIIRDVCEWLWRTEHKIPITRLSAPTNGTLLNDEMKKWLVKNNKRFELLLSFDGTRLMQNINRSDSAANIDLDFFISTYPQSEVKMTLSPETIGYLFEGIQYLYSKGFKFVEASLALGANIGWEKKHLKILDRELNKLIDFYCTHTDARPLNMLSTPVWNIIIEDYKPLVCYCGQRTLCYDWNGKVYPCHLFAPITISPILAKKAQKMDFDEIRKTKNPTCAKCVLTKVCSVCYGMNFKDYGDCTHQSPFYCAQFKLFFYASCILQKRLAQINHESQKEELINETIKYLINTRK